MKRSFSSIMVNGKNYGNFRDLPQFVQQIFSDRDGNGIPDIFEGKVGDLKFLNQDGLRSFNVEGKTYHSFQEMPPAVRQKVEEKLKKLTGLNLGTGFRWNKQQITDSLGAYASGSESSNKWVWIIFGVALALFLILGAAGVVFYLLLFS